MDLAALLARPRLSMITRHADYELARMQDKIEHKVLVDGRGELEEVLGRLLGVRAEPAPKTLDLIGHSTPGRSLLTIGDWVLDAASACVTAFFRGLAEHEVMPRLGVHAVRLLGCQTADTGRGRATICRLSEILGIEVYGTTQLIYSAHCDADGFAAGAEHLLVSASDLRRGHDHGDPLADISRHPRSLDLDALPAAPLIVREHPWPRRIATRDAAREILRLVRRDEGAQMPGLLAAPNCEVALPAGRPSWYYLAQILLDGEFIRFYPDGTRKPGVVYPVDDPHSLRGLVDSLPVASSPVG